MFTNYIFFYHQICPFKKISCVHQLFVMCLPILSIFTKIVDNFVISNFFPSLMRSETKNYYICRKKESKIKKKVICYKFIFENLIIYIS